MSRSTTSYATFMTSQALRRRDVTTEPERRNIRDSTLLQGYSLVKAYNRFILTSKLFGGESLTYLICTRWAREFANGREAVEDEYRSGAPKSVRSENTIESVRQQIDQDPHSSLREISSNLGLSYGTVQTILLEDLTLRKVCARWVPYVLLKVKSVRGYFVHEN